MSRFPYFIRLSLLSRQLVRKKEDRYNPMADRSADPAEITTKPSSAGFGVERWRLLGD